jgi:hypothetical protein
MRFVRFGVETAPTDWALILALAQTLTGRRLREFNGAGSTDILWRNPDGETAIWNMNGTA